jgi:hypothetical protein
MMDGSTGMKVDGGWSIALSYKLDDGFKKNSFLAFYFAQRRSD